MNVFDRTANHIARLMGHPAAFALACLVIVVWGTIGPFVGYSDTWQLVINTSTTIVTFLMVFLIQNTQNRDSHALHLKIDELLRALDAADTRLVDLEERSEPELERLHQHYLNLASHGAEASEAVASELAERSEERPKTETGPRNQTRRGGVQRPPR
jgi:low affinity Fe/Cu permease